MPVVTLTTDFGTRDGHVGEMKGVIWGICPEARVADLSHCIAPQDIREAAYLLGRVTPFFPDGTIHVAVVDPGVGTSRRPIGARLGRSLYVAPDNGLLTVVLDRAADLGDPISLVVLDRPEFWRPVVSRVFHGRDIFAAVAAHLATGMELEDLGSGISDPVRLPLPRPRRTAFGITGEIIHVDRFGNLLTDIRSEDVPDAAPESMAIRISEARIVGLVNTFGDRSPGDIVALMGSSGYLVIAEVNGNAASRLGAKVGDVVDVHFPAGHDGREGG